jgi:chaperonin GroES
MLLLDSHITLTPRTCDSPNLAGEFSQDDLDRIGQHCWEGYDRDEASRADWLRRTSAAMQLALQVAEAKTFPWPGASNVLFPLITIAVMQFHARAYPTMFEGPDLVKYRVGGQDPSGELTEVATAVSRYMSHQCLDLDEAFEEQHDRLLINVPIVGCAFIKTRRNAARGINTSTLVLARDLVIDYYAKSTDEAHRKTHLIPLYRNEVYERCVAGTFLDVLEEPWYASPSQVPQTPAEIEKDRLTGRRRPQAGDDSPLLFGEQHTYLDLDGDGYAEPYIVTFDIASKKVVRIVARWDSPDDVERLGTKILRIRPTESFTKYGLIPDPNGSIYDIGFGVLLGPLNASVNTLVNQLVDAGTLANSAGGFLSRGVKLRGGSIAFRPFGWQHVDSSGDDLKKGIFPAPVREPSPVLFNLLSLLINYVQRISGSGDTLVGENPGQNTPKANMDTMVEQGMKIYSAIFKRMWRSLRDEFRKLYYLNGRHLPAKAPFGTGYIAREMFLRDPSCLVPAADPNLVSESARLNQAVTLKQAAMSTPGYNIPAVEKNFLRALRVDGIEQIYPGPDKVPPLPNPKMAAEQVKTEREKMKVDARMQEFMAGLEETRRVNDAKILQLEAQAAKLVADADDADVGHELKMLDASIQAFKAHNDSINKQMELSLKRQENAANQSGGPAGMAGAPGNPSV